MILWNVWKKPSHDWTQPARDSLHESCALGQAHHAEPERHDPDQSQRDRDRRLRTIEGAHGHIFQAIIPAADCDREQNEREPDVIEHARCCNHVAMRRPALDAPQARGYSRYCYCVVDLLFDRLIAR